MAYEYAYLSTLLYLFAQTILFIICLMNKLSHKYYIRANSFIIVLAFVTKFIGYIILYYSGENYGLPEFHFILNLLIVLVYWNILKFFSKSY